MLYEKLPSIECQGLCYDSCGPIDLSLREKVRMERSAGHSLGVNGLTCNMLGADHRCTVYDERPMICRMWGVMESMPCIYGCKAVPGLLADAEGAMLMVESLRIGGGLSHSDEELFQLLAQAQAEDPEGFAENLAKALLALGTRPTLEGRGQVS